MIAFVLGKPVRAGTIFPELFDALRDKGIEPRLHLPHDAGDAMPEWMASATLAVHRGLRPASLEALSALERAGLPCMNPVASVRLVEDRALLAERLAASGLPVPRTDRVATWAEATDRAEAGALIVKRIDGRIGRGAGIATLRPGEARGEPPFPGPYVVQEALETEGVDRKVYVAGADVRGLLKRWPRHDPASSCPFEPDPAIAGLARDVGRKLRLDVFGLDVVVCAGGPMIVDVNAFPGFKGVPGAVSLIAGQIARRAPTGRVLTARGPRHRPTSAP